MKEENDATTLCKKHDSYELKWDGERDNKEYKKKSEEQRQERVDIDIKPNASTVLSRKTSTSNPLFNIQ